MYNSKSLFLFPNQLIVAKSEKFSSYKENLIDLCYLARDQNGDRRVRSNRLGWQSKKGDFYKEEDYLL